MPADAIRGQPRSPVALLSQGHDARPETWCQIMT